MLSGLAPKNSSRLAVTLFLITCVNALDALPASPPRMSSYPSSTLRKSEKFLIDGEYAGSVARIPKKGSVTANFHTGGIAKKVGLVRRDKKICSILKPFLKKKKLFFTGIDVIGNYLTEINVTSPTGIQEINKLNRVNGIGGHF